MPQRNQDTQINPTARVFLSYSRDDDEKFVRKLYKDLAEEGFEVWFDRESLMSRGKTYHKEIRDAIRTEIDRLIYVHGPKAADSAHVREEWKYALGFDHVVVLPILRFGSMEDNSERHRLLIDSGTLIVLLDIEHYQLGSRSMERLLASFKVKTEQDFKISYLQSEEALEINVGSLVNIKALLNRIVDFQNNASALAVAFHNN